MNEDLQEYIKSLSVKDTKTLSQKLGKVMEEAGELARVTLPFDNAAGTTHRFIEKERVLEESVDTILSAISMAYDLGFSHDDIEEMMWRKAQKWQGIQAKEEKIEYPIPYEIHVTVDLERYFIDSYVKKQFNGGTIMYPDKDRKEEQQRLRDNAIEHFKETCEEIGVKPIVLDLENSGKSVMKDVMTSHRHMGTNTSAYRDAKKLESLLEDAGFEVVRVKIETVPWHPAAPTKPGDKMPEDCYFEAHIGCVITPEEKPLLEHNTKKFGAHLSRNFFKKIEGGKFVNMLTLRESDVTYDQFEKNLEAIKARLVEENIEFEFEKVITEFSIYDTKVSHDFKWVEKLEVDQFVEVRKEEI
jgi:NTP pyrophosphatase (non-canonical NTP hydrolase)